MKRLIQLLCVATLAVVPLTAGCGSGVDCDEVSRHMDEAAASGNDQDYERYSDQYEERCKEDRTTFEEVPADVMPTD